MFGLIDLTTEAGNLSLGTLELVLPRRAARPPALRGVTRVCLYPSGLVHRVKAQLPVRHHGRQFHTTMSHNRALGSALEGVVDRIESDHQRGLLAINKWRVEVEVIGFAPPRQPCSMGLNSLEQICETFGLGSDLHIATYGFEQYAANARQVLSFANQAGAYQGSDDHRQVTAEKRALAVSYGPAG